MKHTIFLRFIASFIILLPLWGLGGFLYAQNTPPPPGAGGLDSLLLVAVKANDLEKVKTLVEQGANVNAKDTQKGNYSEGYTPLHHAKSIEVAQFLIDKGVDIQAKNNNGDTPLHNALVYSHFDIAKFLIAKFLIEKGADIQAKNNNGETALHLATGNEQVGIAQLLIDKGADVNARQNGGNTPLYFIRNLSITQMLIKNGADVNAKNIIGRSPLHSVIENGQLEIAQLLIEKGAKINARDNGGVTPFHLVIDLNSAQLLLAKGADINALDKDGNNALHYDLINAKYGFHNGSDKGLMAFFIAQGLNNNTRNKVGKTPYDILNDLGYRSFESLTEEFNLSWALQAEDGSLFDGDSLSISALKQKFSLICINYPFNKNDLKSLQVFQFRGGRAIATRLFNINLLDFSQYQYQIGDGLQISFSSPNLNPLGKIETNYITSYFGVFVKE